MHKVGKTHPKARCAEKTVMNTSPPRTVFVSVFKAKRKAHVFQLTAVLLSNVGTPFALGARKLPRKFLASETGWGCSDCFRLLVFILVLSGCLCLSLSFDSFTLFLFHFITCDICKVHPLTQGTHCVSYRAVLRRCHAQPPSHAELRCPLPAGIVMSLVRIALRPGWV